MLIHVNPKSDTPLYRQVVTQVQALIATKKLRAGDRVPSVRELAVDIRINPNTVARAYRELQRLGILETRSGAGSFVTAGEVSWGRKVREDELRARLQEALDAAVSMGIDPATTQEMFEKLAKQAFRERE